MFRWDWLGTSLGFDPELTYTDLRPTDRSTTADWRRSLRLMVDFDRNTTAAADCTAGSGHNPGYSHIAAA